MRDTKLVEEIARRARARGRQPKLKRRPFLSVTVAYLWFSVLYGLAAWGWTTANDATTPSWSMLFAVAALVVTLSLCGLLPGSEGLSFSRAKLRRRDGHQIVTNVSVSLLVTCLVAAVAHTASVPGVYSPPIETAHVLSLILWLFAALGLCRMLACGSNAARWTVVLCALALSPILAIELTRVAHPSLVGLLSPLGVLAIAGMIYALLVCAYLSSSARVIRFFRLETQARLNTNA